MKITENVVFQKVYTFKQLSKQKVHVLVIELKRQNVKKNFFFSQYGYHFVCLIDMNSKYILCQYQTKFKYRKGQNDQFGQK